MSTEPDQPKKAPAKRGEAAWKEEKERIAERNAQVRKAGREQREEYERGQSEARHAREVRQMTDLLGKQGSK